MSSGRRDVVFFGSLSVSIIGHTVKDVKLMSALKDHAIVVRTSATTVSDSVEEAFGAVGVSAPLPTAPLAATPAAAPTTVNTTPARKSRGGSSLTSTAPSAADAECHVEDGFRLQRASFLPLLIKLAQDVAAEETHATTSTWGGDNADATLETAEDTHIDANVHVELHSLSAAAASSPPPPQLLAGRTLSIPSLHQHAEADTCSVIRVEVPSSALHGAAAQADAGTRPFSTSSASEDEVALVLYVMVRVVDLTEKVSVLLEADTALRHFLALPEPTPCLTVRRVLTTAAPYGVMPLVELYEHYLRLWSFATGKTLKPNAEVVAMLAGTVGPDEDAAVKAADESYPHRWNAIRKIDLDRVLLGDDGFAPLLLTLAHCPNVTTLVADRNALGDLSCGRLAALLASHRCLTAVSVVGNRVYEGGADQLLRLARRNLRVALVDVAGNPCSPGIASRIKRVTAANWAAFSGDLLNVFTDRYAHITSPATISLDTIKIALSVWAMLIASPVGDVDVWVRNTTTQILDPYADDRAIPRMKAMSELSHVYTSIPAVARAPLLNEVQRTVYVGISRAVRDPLVRSVFTDVERVTEMNRKAREQELTGGASLRNASLHTSPLDAPVGGDERGNGMPAELERVLHLPTSSRVLPEDELYSVSFLRIVVVTMRAVACAEPWEAVAKTLLSIGQQQKLLGVSMEDYILATHVFVKSLYVTCGEDNITSEWAGAFLTVLALGLRTAVGHYVTQGE